MRKKKRSGVLIGIFFIVFILLAPNAAAIDMDVGDVTTTASNGYPTVSCDIDNQDKDIGIGEEVTISVDWWAYDTSSPGSQGSDHEFQMDITPSGYRFVEVPLDYPPTSDSGQLEVNYGKVYVDTVYYVTVYCKVGDRDPPYYIVDDEDSATVTVDVPPWS